MRALECLRGVASRVPGSLPLLCFRTFRVGVGAWGLVWRVWGFDVGGGGKLKRRFRFFVQKTGNVSDERKGVIKNIEKN